MKLRSTIGFVLLLLGMRGYAHDPNLATFTIFRVDETWVLRADLTTSMVDRSLRQAYPDKFSTLSEAAYKELIVQYLRENIHVRLDEGEFMEMGGGGIKLDDHSTVVMLALPGFDPRWTSLQCEITCFKDNPKQSNLLRVQMGEERNFRAFLREGNNFQATFSQGTRIFVVPAGAE